MTLQKENFAHWKKEMKGEFFISPYIKGLLIKCHICEANGLGIYSLSAISILLVHWYLIGVESNYWQSIQIHGKFCFDKSHKLWKYIFKLYFIRCEQKTPLVSCASGQLRATSVMIQPDNLDLVMWRRYDCDYDWIGVVRIGGGQFRYVRNSSSYYYCILGIRSAWANKVARQLI